MVKRAWILLFVPLLLAACAPSAQQQADYDSVQRSGVSPAIYDKMMHGDALSVSDIAALGHARVNDGIVIRYIRDHQTVYYLSQGDMQYLASAGVSPSVIDYMNQTARGNWGAGGPYPPVSIGLGFGFGGGGRGWR